MSKIIDFGYGIMPRGFSNILNDCYDLVDIDIYCTPDFSGGTLILFSSEDQFVLVTAKGKKNITYYELERYELLNAIYSDGDYFHSFFIAENIFANPTGTKVKLIALLFEERGKIHFWNPTFEELFLPLIFDDIENSTDSHLRGLQEIHQKGDPKLNVYDIVVKNNVDHEIEGFQGMNFTTVVYYALMNHIFLVETEKYPTIPGGLRTLIAYKDLFNDHLNDCVDMIKWRKRYNLHDPWR